MASPEVDYSAEGGEIRKNVQFLEWDKAREQKAEAEKILAPPKGSLVLENLWESTYEEKAALNSEDFQPGKNSLSLP